ncbi:MAG: hypothetical protein ACN4G0_09285 [Polyangiales bacterium]
MNSNLVCIAVAIALQTQTAQAQGDLLGADEMAETIVSMTSRVWTGPRTPIPEPVARPGGTLLDARSGRALVALHADPGVSAETLRGAMGALEEARARLGAMGWPGPIPDGARGGGPELDLYLSGALPAGAHSDAMVSWSYLDRASAFAVVDPATPSSSLDACVTEAYAEALLLSLDPAEARAWRRATAAWLTWEITGRLGCDEAVTQQQTEPHRSWISGAAGAGAGGALWLAHLSARHDGARGRFLCDVWGLASQRTWEGAELRADPDLWSAIETAVNLSGDKLLDNVEELAVLRWFVGRAHRDDVVVRALDPDMRVPVSRTMTRLPTRIVGSPSLAPFGSAYVVMNGDTWNGHGRLRAWLRGEYGVHWSFVAVQLDADGSETARISAPPTGAEPKAYLPLQLHETTEQLLFVVTNLSDGLPDADEAEVHQRAFELIVDVADD